MLHLKRHNNLIIRGIEKLNAFLLEKGTGVLRINVFAAKAGTGLNQIEIDGNYSVCIINEKVLNGISRIRGRKKYNQLKKVLNKGGYGISIYQADELAAYGWIGMNKGKHSRRIFTPFAIPHDSAHIFECYTVKKFRGRKLYQAIVYQLAEQAKSEQAKNIYIDTVFGNYVAEKGVSNLGFDHVSFQTTVLFLNKVIFQYDRKR